MKIIIDRNTPDSRQSPVIEIDTKNCHYVYAIREALELALQLDGHTKQTIGEVFNWQTTDYDKTKGCVDCDKPTQQELYDTMDWLNETPI